MALVASAGCWVPVPGQAAPMKRGKAPALTLMYVHIYVGMYVCV